MRQGWKLLLSHCSGRRAALMPAAGCALTVVPPGNPLPSSRRCPAASAHAHQGAATPPTRRNTARSMRCSKNDRKLRAKIKQAAAAYGIDPMHIVGAIVGEHTYNVDAYDRLQTYYVKAVSYLGRQLVLQPMTARRSTISSSGRNLPAAPAPSGSYDLWTCREAVWNRASAARRWTARVSERPLQRRLLPALLCRPDLRHRPAQPADRAGDERHRRTGSRACRRSTAAIRARLQDDHGSRPDLALCRGDAEEVDRRLQVDRRLRHLAESRASPRRSTMSAIRRRAPPRSRPRTPSAASSRGSSQGCRRKIIMAGWSTTSCRSCRRCFDTAAKVPRSFVGSASRRPLQRLRQRLRELSAIARDRRCDAGMLGPGDWRARWPPATSPAVSITTRGSDVCGQPLQLLGIVPDHVEIADDLLDHRPARHAAPAMFERRQIGGADAERRGHLLLRTPLPRRSSRIFSPNGVMLRGPRCRRRSRT